MAEVRLRRSWLRPWRDPRRGTIKVIVTQLDWTTSELIRRDLSVRVAIYLVLGLRPVIVGFVGWAAVQHFSDVVFVLLVAFMYAWCAVASLANQAKRGWRVVE